MEVLTSYPHDGEPLLAFYNGAYDWAFVALHPFCNIPGQHPREYAPRTLNIKRSALGADLSGPQLLASADQVAESRRVGKGDSMLADALAKRDGLEIGWEQVGRDAGFRAFGAVNCALRTGIGALRAEFADPEGAARLERHCDDNALFMPSEGRFQPLMERSIARLFQGAGVDAVEVAAEFDEAGRLLTTGTLDADEPWGAATIPADAKRLFAADRTLLVVVEWDSFFTLICGRRERLPQVQMTDLFDGFWCDADTSHLWWKEQPREFKKEKISR